MARLLNDTMHTNQFTIWNLGDIPEVDIARMRELAEEMKADRKRKQKNG